MIRSIVKHSYIKGRNGKARAQAHVNYIAYRSGQDREHGGRKFFDRARDDIDVRQVKQFLHAGSDNAGATIHKLMLSPGMQEVDIKEYTRELMETLEREKGLNLEWQAVIHDNTDHRHVHVVVLGKDRLGVRVRFDRQDHKHLRQHGDEYLDREHKLERYLDRDLHELLRSREYDRGGDEYFRELVYGGHDDQKHEHELNREREQDKDREERQGPKDRERDRQEFQEFDEKMRRTLQEQSGQNSGFNTGRKQRIREQQGRLSECHADYTGSMSKQRFEQIADQYPDQKEQINSMLNDLQELTRQDRVTRNHDRELDRLLGIDPQLQHDQSIHRQSWTTFETDRQVKDGQEQERQRDDLNRSDEPGYTGGY